MRGLFVLSFAAALSWGAPFHILSVERPASNCGTECLVSVVTAGTPSTADGRTAEQILSTASSWQLRALGKKGEEMIPIAITGAKAVATGIGTSLAVELRFAKAQLGGEDPQTLKWSVLYLGSGDFQIASREPEERATQTPSSSTPAKKIFGAAESREKADLYFSGNVLAGVGTKPIYTLDAKVNIAPPLHWHGVRAGVTGEIQSNANSEPPNDKSEIDPDSIRAYATVNGLWKNFYWDIRPAGGEFSRKYPASSFVPAGNFAWWLNPVKVPGGTLVIYPSIGTELGMNLNRPAALFKLPVDLSHYDSIRRLVPGIDAAYRVWGTKDKPTLTFAGTYQARVLFADEPFTTLQYYTTASGARQREKVAQLRTNTRHWVEGTATWNLNEFVGLTAQYKYGSLPPLFELTRQQITFGLVFKSTLWPR